MNQNLAFACLSRITEFCLKQDLNNQFDPLYKSPEFGIEFANTIKNFNTQIMDDPNYAVLLNAFANFLLIVSF